jgi:hypothetical protein
LSVWFVIPSKRPRAEANACLEAWKDQGYNTAILREVIDGRPANADVCLPTIEYLGWARSVNLLIASTLAYEKNVEWFVTGGDDYYPDPTKTADEIAAECGEYFMRTPLHDNPENLKTYNPKIVPPTFGVMQPTGDRWGEGTCQTCKGYGLIDRGNAMAADAVTCPSCKGTRISATIDRIAGSPWMGREFCRRMYHGSGPMYNGYYHNFADEELQNVALKLGVFWQRRDLIQEHRHWATARPRSEGHTGISGDVRNMPEWARKINDPKLSDWDKSKALFAARKAAGFPGHEPLEL